MILLPFFMKKELSGLDGIVYWKGCDVDKAINLPGWVDGACLYRYKFLIYFVTELSI